MQFSDLSSGVSDSSSLHPQIEQLNNIGLRGVGNQKILETIGRFKAGLPNQASDLIQCIHTKVTESQKRQAHKLGVIAVSFERFGGTLFKELVQSLSVDQLEQVTKKLATLQVCGETQDNLARVFTLVEEDLRGLIISAFLHDKQSDGNTMERYIGVLQDQLILSDQISTKFDRAVHFLARSSAQGKRRSGYDQLVRIANHTPLAFIPALLATLSVYEPSSKDPHQIQPLRNSLIHVADTFTKNAHIRQDPESFSKVFQQTIDTAIGLIQLHPNHKNTIAESIINICEGPGAKDPVMFCEGLKKWFGTERFSETTFGKPMVALTQELGDISHALNALKLLQKSPFTQQEQWQIEQMLERLSTLPATREKYSPGRRMVDHMEPWVAATVRTLGRNGMQQIAFQQWLFGDQTGLSPFLQAYGCRPASERLSEIITQLEQFYVKSQANVGRNLDRPVGGALDEKNFWSRAGWRARRVLNVVTTLTKNIEPSQSEKILHAIESSAKEFFAIFKGATALKSGRKIPQTPAELDRAEKRYSEALQTLAMSPHRGWMLSHLAAQQAAELSPTATSNQFRNKLHGIKRKLHRLYEACENEQEKEETDRVFCSEIERKFSLASVQELLEWPNALESKLAITYFLAPNLTKGISKNALTKDDVHAALECAGRLLRFNGEKRLPKEMQSLIRTISEQFELKTVLAIVEAVFDKQASTGIKNGFALLQGLAEHKIKIDALHKCRNEICVLQKQLPDLPPEKYQEVLSLVINKEILPDKSFDDITKLSHCFAAIYKRRLDSDADEAVVSLLAKHGKKFHFSDIVTVAHTWLNVYPLAHGKESIGCLDSLLSRVDKKADIAVLLSLLPANVDSAQLKPFISWALTLKPETLLTVIEQINTSRTLPDEWKLLQKFGAFTEWELLPAETVRQLAAGQSASLLKDIQSVKGIPSRQMEIGVSLPLFPAPLPDRLALALKDALPPIPKPKDRKDCTTLEAARIWCADRIVDYRWRLVTCRDLDKRALLVTEALNNLATFRQKNKTKEVIIQSFVKLAPVWSLEGHSKASLAGLTVKDLINVMRQYGLEEVERYADDILDYAVKLTGAQPLAYFHRHRDRFDITDEYLEEILAQSAAAAGRQSTPHEQAPVKYDEEPSEEGIPLQSLLSKAYMTGAASSAFSDNQPFSSAPSQEDLLRMRLTRTLDKVRATQDPTDQTKLTAPEVLWHVQNDLRSMVSKKQSAEQITDLIEAALPLFLEGVQEKRFPSTVAKFIDQEISEYISNEQLCERVRHLLAERVGIVSLFRQKPQGHIEHNSVFSLSSELDQKIADLLWQYWYRNFDELESVGDIVLDSLIELQTAPLGYEVVLRKSIGTLLSERYSDFEKVLQHAQQTPDISSTVYLTAAVKSLLKGTLKNELSEAECLLTEQYGMVATELNTVVHMMETALAASSVSADYRQRSFVQTEVYEITGELKKKLQEQFHNPQTTSRNGQRATKKNGSKLFIVSCKQTDAPLMIAEVRKNQATLHAKAVPLLTGRNKQATSSLVGNLVKLTKSE